MALYARRQLVLLLLIVGAALLGLGVRAWRGAYPDLADRLERLDRAEPGPAAAPGPPPARMPRPGPTRGQASPSPSPTQWPREPLDLNRASAADLDRLPGIGPRLAARIVETREARGPFATVDDLRGVPGIGRARVERLRAVLHIVPGAAADRE